MIRGEAVIRVHRRRQIIHCVAGRHCNFKCICIAGRSVKFDRKHSRLFGLKQCAGLDSDRSQSYEKQVAGTLRVVVSVERVVETKGLIRQVEIDDARLCDVKIGKRSGQRSLNRLDLVFVVGHGARGLALKQCGDRRDFPTIQDSIKKWGTSRLSPSFSSGGRVVSTIPTGRCHEGET